LRLREKNSYQTGSRLNLSKRRTCLVAIGFEKLISCAGLSRLCDFARLDATGANLLALNAACGALHTNGLQVGIKATARAVVRVGNIVAELRAFAANFASFSHDF
jgi:hypothetical protein